MTEDADWSDRKQAYSECHRFGRRVGDSWHMQLRDKETGYWRFVTVLKIAPHEYRYFDDPEHAKAQQVLRGFDASTSPKKQSVPAGPWAKTRRKGPHWI